MGWLANIISVLTAGLILWLFFILIDYGFDCCMCGASDAMTPDCCPCYGPQSEYCHQVGHFNLSHPACINESAVRDWRAEMVRDHT